MITVDLSFRASAHTGEGMADFLRNQLMKIVKNGYYDQFRCLAGRCPDSCCKEWAVQVDEQAAAYYRSLPGPLGDRLRQVLVTQDGETVMTIENGRCPMWRHDGLCRIQAELGADALCRVCRDFPRLRHDYGTFVELGLELSCPEAARLLLTQPRREPVTEQIPGISRPDYEQGDMDILLSTRREMLNLLQGRPVGEALALGLLYGYHAQALLDGEEPGEFDPGAALETARKFAAGGSIFALPVFFSGLEILTETWKNRLRSLAPAPWDEAHRALAVYGVERYWLQAISDFDLMSRVKMIVVSCLLVKNMGGDTVETAQLYAKEIENDADNIDAILDAAYTCPAFTDAKLLDLLLAEQ